MLRRNDPTVSAADPAVPDTAVLSDVLDELGFPGQAMPPSIRPLDDDLTLAGFAGPAVARGVPPAPKYPDELEIALVDDLKPDEVAVFGCCGSRRIAPWGRVAVDRIPGARCGRLRDRWHGPRYPRHSGHAFSGLSRWHRASTPKVGARSPRSTRPSGVAGSPSLTGDLVVGDADGVIVVPRAVEEEALRRAFAKVAGGSSTRRAGGGARSSRTFSPNTAFFEEIASIAGGMT